MTKATKTPPGPEGSPEELNRIFNADPFNYLEALERQYGTLFTLRLGNLGNDHVLGVDYNGQWTFLTRPHQLEYMYEQDEEVVSGAHANKIFFGTNEASVGYIDSKAHKCRRSLLHPSFNGSTDYSALIQEVLGRRMASWPREEPFALFLELQKMTSEIITEVVCGNMEPQDREELRAMLPRTENAKYSRDELRNAEMAIRAYVQQRIDGYLEKAVRSGREDVFAMLLRHGQEGDTSLTNDVVRDEVFSLLYTGFSTTANTLSWAFLRILGDERVRQRLTQELRDVLGDRPVSRKDLSDLPYLDATLKEILRLHPVTPLNGVRMLKKPLEIDGHLVPAGTILVHCAYLIQRSADVFPEPLRFQPERFLDKKIDPYAWGAFGGGSRICIGRGFSVDEMKIVLSTVFRRLRMETVGSLPPAKMQGFFMAPEDGARIVIRA